MQDVPGSAAAGETDDLNNVGDYIRQILKFDPYMLKGFPSTFYYLARHLHENGMKLNIKACFANGETLYPFMRDYIQEHFGCGIHDHYGSEGVETACQCDPRSKHHIASETVIPEIVDRDGNRVPPGTEGRFLVTSLSKWAFPFLRYDTQDVASLTDEQCFCGRGLPLIETIKGRIVDLSVTPSGKPLSVYAFHTLFAKADGIEAWQIVHESPSELIVRIVPGTGLKKETVDGIRTYMEDYCGDDVNVHIEEVTEIPLTSSGKRRYFISKCPYGPLVH